MGVQTHEHLSVYKKHIRDDCSCQQKPQYIKSVLAARMADESGQSTVEYAVVLSGFLLVVVVLALFISAARDGSFIQKASDACAYATKSSLISALQDALLF